MSGIRAGMEVEVACDVTVPAVWSYCSRCVGLLHKYSRRLYNKGGSYL